MVRALRQQLRQHQQLPPMARMQRMQPIGSAYGRSHEYSAIEGHYSNQDDACALIRSGDMSKLRCRRS